MKDLHSLLGQCKGFYNLIDALKVLREDSSFNSVDMLFHIFASRKDKFCHDIPFV